MLSLGVKYLSHINSIIFPMIIHFLIKVILKKYLLNLITWVTLSFSTIFSTKCSTILQS